MNKKLSSSGSKGDAYLNANSNNIQQTSIQIEDLPTYHTKLLENIIRFAFIDNQTNNITKEIRKLL